MLCEYYNWQKAGTAEIEQAVEAANKMQVRMQPMIGLIFPFATTNPPDGCLVCDGSIYNRVDYPGLYAVLASAYILNADQFIVPDCKAKVIAGAGNYDGTEFTLADFLGSSYYQLQDFEMPSHNHSVHGHIPTLALEPGELPVDSPGFDGVTGDSGGNQAHLNIQPTIVLNYAIVAQ